MLRGPETKIMQLLASDGPGMFPWMDMAQHDSPSKTIQHEMVSSIGWSMDIYRNPTHLMGTTLVYSRFSQLFCNPLISKSLKISFGSR